MFLAHEKAFNTIFFLRLDSSSSKYAASKVLMDNSFEFWYGSYNTYVSALIYFVITLTIYSSRVALRVYDVRSSHVVSLAYEQD